MQAQTATGVEYWVYENRPNDKAVGHAATCAHFKKNGGQMLRTGEWHGPFDSRQDATTYGTTLGRPFHWCPFC
jgi:hypothetical protein